MKKMFSVAAVAAVMVAGSRQGPQSFQALN